MFRAVARKHLITLYMYIKYKAYHNLYVQYEININQWTYEMQDLLIENM